MAKTSKPIGTKGTPIEEASDNLETGSSEDVGLNFKVSRGFRREFKQLALDSDMKLNEFLKHLVELHKAR